MYQDNAADENLATKIATSTIKDVPSNSDEPLFECEDSEIQEAWTDSDNQEPIQTSK